jgi:hypothetical protein
VLEKSEEEEEFNIIYYIIYMYKKRDFELFSRFTSAGGGREKFFWGVHFGDVLPTLLPHPDETCRGETLKMPRTARTQRTHT